MILYWNRCKNKHQINTTKNLISSTKEPVLDWWQSFTSCYSSLFRRCGWSRRRSRRWGSCCCRSRRSTSRPCSRTSPRPSSRSSSPCSWLSSTHTDTIKKTHFYLNLKLTSLSFEILCTNTAKRHKKDFSPFQSLLSYLLGSPKAKRVFNSHIRNSLRREQNTLSVWRRRSTNSRTRHSTGSRNTLHSKIPLAMAMTKKLTSYLLTFNSDFYLLIYQDSLIIVS